MWRVRGFPFGSPLTTMGSNDLFVCVDHMLGPRYQRYDWQTGMRGSLRRGKTVISNPRCLAEESTCGKAFRRQPRGKIRSGAPKCGLMINSDHSRAAPQGGMEPHTDKTHVVSTRRRVPTNRVSGRTLQPYIESVVTNSVTTDFLLDGQVSGLGTVHPLLTLNFFSRWILPLHLVFFPLLFCVQSPSPK